VPDKQVGQGADPYNDLQGPPPSAAWCRQS